MKQILMGLAVAGSAISSQAQLSGQWDFENGSLDASVGNALEYASGVGGPASLSTSFNTTTGFGIPDIGGVVAKVLKAGAYEAGDGLNLPTPAEANAGGNYVNDYTLIMDVLFPAESIGKARALFDTDLGVLNPDAEFFVNADNSVGLKGAGFGQIASNVWYRVAYVVDANDTPDVYTGTIRFYINGNEVGARNIGNLKDDRFALAPAATARLFSDDDGETAPIYLNSIQLRAEALSKGQVRALGAPTASGIPQVLPPVPSGIERWIPRGEFASRNTMVGAVIATGSTTIQDSSITTSLNGASQSNLTIQREGDLIRVNTAVLTLTSGQKYTNVVSYTDSLAGQRSFTNVFTAALFFEGFDDLVLGPGLEEAHAADIGWTNQPPAGWTIDNTQMAGIESPDDDGDGRPDRDGRSEWLGWAFADKDWWVRADDQRRSEFALASGTVAIADPDEWDDASHDPGLFNSFLVTPPIPLTGLGANTAFLRFVSSWRPEGRDDGAPNFPVDDNGQPVNNQTAIVLASYDGGAPIQILKWDSIEGSPTFHGDFPNEAVLLPLNNPAGAQNLVLTFALTNAANDWWWAVDNITVTSGASVPTITLHPLGGHYSVGGNLSLSVTANGTEPFTYQWKRNGEAITGATGRNFVIDYLETDAARNYTVVVSNAAGSVESNPAGIQLFSGQLTNGLVAHLKFDGNLEDSSKDNDGSPVGEPTFLAGKIGQAVQVNSGANYVTLGTPADLNFGTTNDFSFSFWALINGLDGDPSIIGNKDWNSGGNAGYVLFSAGNRRIDWNLAGAPGTRKDSDGVANVFTNDTWKHVVATFDRDGNTVIYIDGVVANVTAIGANENNLNTPEGFATNIGQDGTGAYGSFFTDLRMDDLGIWQRVLTAQEVQAIYAGGNLGKTLTDSQFTPPATRITGQWDFENGDLSATVGQALEYMGDIAAGTSFTTLNINGQAAKVMSFPAATSADAYIVHHGASTNGGGNFVNVYSVVMDVMFPASSTGAWRGLWQTSENNSNDGDFFINTANGIGISGNYTGQVLADSWHRIVFVVDLPKSTLSKYIDGVPVGTQNISPVDGRFSLGATALLFTDEDGETAPGFVNSIQFREGALRPVEVAALGGATAEGIPSGMDTTPQARLGISRSGATLTITVNSPGTYQLQRKRSLTEAAWVNVGTSSTTGSFTAPADENAGFFRVVQIVP